VLLFLPIFISANIDLVWLSTLICVNLQPSFLTSPSGWSGAGHRLHVSWSRYLAS
jgi:TRAP-type mannitol/chloroaromatic compound transport system permease large subunit